MALRGLWVRCERVNCKSNFGDNGKIFGMGIPKFGCEFLWWLAFFLPAPLGGIWSGKKFL